MRSIMTTSAPSSASSKSVVASTPISSIRGGSSVGGPQTMTCAPIFVSSQMFERTTRECAMSPDDRDAQALEPPEALADRQRVEQRLRRVLVRAVARVDDARLEVAREEVRHARASRGG